MKYALYGLGIIAAGIFIYSIYAFLVHPEQFKTVAYIFMFIAAAFFILVIIRKVREEKSNRIKINSIK